MSEPVKERPILFSAPMVRAILDGRKTQTRRILKPQPEGGVQRHFSGVPINGKGNCLICRYGKPGDRLWVRETWARYNIDQDSHDVAYRATAPADWPTDGNWRPSIHMPRWASRITLEIISVRMERIQDICFEDRIAEGVSCAEFSHLSDDWEPGRGRVAETRNELVDDLDDECRWRFMKLWQSISGPGSWDANPWVWVIGFERADHVAN